jgi:hypothetical protein
MSSSGPRCFICLVRLQAAERDATRREPVKLADTIYQGTALCAGHIILGTPPGPDGSDPADGPGPAPGLQARSARLWPAADQPLRVASG